MKHISELKDIGQGRTCLIVGGGMSVKDFNFELVPHDVIIIGTNNHEEDRADIIIFYDKEMQEYYDTRVTFSEFLIGFKNNTLDHTTNECTHYYEYKDMEFGDTGYHALQFADKIFNFSNIYLIGYDYKTNGKTYHYEEDESDNTKLERFKTWSIEKVLPKYEAMGWNNKIYNCSTDTALKIFKHRVLTKRK